jgi:hypothetical protein
MFLSLPETLISVVGIEKLAPTWHDLEVFMQLPEGLSVYLDCGSEGPTSRNAASLAFSRWRGFLAGGVTGFGIPRRGSAPISPSLS